MLCVHTAMRSKKKGPYQSGERIAYASRVFDEDEMSMLVDSALDFWLTSGRFTARFEEDFSEFLGVRFTSLVNSGSSANLLAFMALTSPLLRERRILPGDEVITVARGFQRRSRQSSSMARFRCLST
jgi:CDP-6-deoxy-D-xylo-4-hexulose-3-dehydrase